MLAGLCLFGTMSFVALRQAITTSKRETLLRREQRIFAYLHELDANEDPRSWTLQLRDYAEAAPEGRLIEVDDLEGKRLFPQSDVPSPGIRWPSGPNCATPCFGEAVLDGLPLRTMRHDVILSTKPVRLYVAGSLIEHFDILVHFRAAMLWYLPLVLVLSMLGGYMLSARALKPVDRMTRTAVEIGITNLSKRIPVETTDDEIQRLAEAWNDLLARLEGSVARQQQFTSDASHDLRTSIGVILATGQLILRHQRTEDEYRDAIATMVSECDSTSHLLDDLLLLARGDALATKVEQLPVNIATLVKDTAQRATGLASAKAQRIEVHSYSELIFVLGDSKLLRRLLSILIDNAVRYTPVGGAIYISLARQADNSVRLSVQDNGVGIPAQHLSKIFDRFYRADAVRNRNSGGSGLGLAIAKWIATLHSAEISVISAPNDGSTFTVRFPQYLGGRSLPAEETKAELTIG